MFQYPSLVIYQLLIKILKKVDILGVDILGVDILGVDILGVDILGVDILRLTPQDYGRRVSVSKS